MLAEPFGKPWSGFFPEVNQKNDPDHGRRSTIDVLWQLRHSIAHNAGVITRSDAAKLRLLRRGRVDGPRVLQMTNGDVWYVKLFLDDLAQWANSRVATQLGKVLTAIHGDDPTLFVAASIADVVAQTLREPVTIAGASALPR